MPVDVPLYPVNLLVAGRGCWWSGAARWRPRRHAACWRPARSCTWWPPTVSEEVRALDVTWEERPYARGEVAGYRLAVACTDDPARQPGGVRRR